MEFKIEQSVFSKLLKNVSPFSAQKGTLEVLRYAHIVAEEGFEQRLTVEGTDLESSCIQRTNEVAVVSEGNLLIQAQQLRQAVDSLEGEVHVKLADVYVTIRDDNGSKFKLRALPPDQYPVISSVNPMGITINAHLLQKMIKATSYISKGSSGSRYPNGLYFEFNHNVFVIAGLSNTRMAMWATPLTLSKDDNTGVVEYVDDPESPDIIITDPIIHTDKFKGTATEKSTTGESRAILGYQFVLSTDSISKLLPLLDDIELVSLKGNIGDGKLVGFDLGQVEVGCTELNSSYMPFYGVLSELMASKEYTANVLVDKLGTEVKKASIAINPIDPCLTFTHTDDSINLGVETAFATYEGEVSPFSPSVGEGEEPIPAITGEWRGVISANPKFMEQAIAAFDGLIAQWNICPSKGAMFLSSGNQTHIVMLRK